MRVKLVILSIAILTFSISSAQAFTPTAEQIEQFKKLPPAEQEALARSMGIDFNDISKLLSKSDQLGDDFKLSPPVSGDRRAQIDQADEESIDPRPIKPVKGDELGKLSLEEDETPEVIEEKLELYGYDIFRYGADSFTPANDIPVPANYILGPGDSLIVQLYGKENETHALQLNRQGQIFFPNIGPISLAGISFKDAQEKIEEVVSNQMIGIKSSVTMGALRTIRIFVLGEAQVPGSYVVGSLSTMTNAIFASGGITEVGSLRNIQLKRSGQIVATLDLYDLLLKGDTSEDSRLLPGDVIFIPPIGKTVGVSGEVKRPAIYEIKNEKSVHRAVQLAGGLLPTAYMPASRIERITAAGEKTLVNLDLSTKPGQNFPLQDADLIQIFSTLDTMQDIVKLEGHVKRPGGFAWRENMRFTDIVGSVDSLKANPDIEIGLIQREQVDTRKVKVVLFSPKKAFEAPDSDNNPLLAPRDTVMLFDYETERSELLELLMYQLKTQASFEERQQTTQIEGSVRFPGEYPLAKNMTARQLVKLSGGLTESALGSKAEITRYDIDDERRTVVMHLDVNIINEDPYLIAGDTLRILQVPLWQEKESVSIFGEVAHPGNYRILPGETLVDVLNRAGGLTPHAYPEGAVFSREELRVLEAKRLEDLKEKIESDIAATNLQESAVKKAKVDEAEKDQILKNIENVKALGRMVIDLPSIIRNPKTYDFQLTDGDVLEIPKYKPSVTVVGEIQYPTSHFYDPKLSAVDYIERSGGTKLNADKKRMYIVKANGRVYLPSNSSWFKAKSKSIEPGDTIVVPLDTDKVDKITMWSSVTQIMYQAALGVAAIGKL